jgi:hypothetical protein
VDLYEVSRMRVGSVALHIEEDSRSSILNERKAEVGSIKRDNTAQ